MQTDKGWQYYYEDGNIVKSSWIQDKGTSKWYFVDANGYKLLGWQYINGKWYMLDTATGEMKIGWYKEAVINKDNSKDNNKTENWYYLDDDGSMKMGWLSIGGVWYYFNKSGVFAVVTICPLVLDVALIKFLFLSYCADRKSVV